jgi:hypothetical protein
LATQDNPKTVSSASFEVGDVIKDDQNNFYSITDVVDKAADPQQTYGTYLTKYMSDSNSFRLYTTLADANYSGGTYDTNIVDASLVPMESNYPKFWIGMTAEEKAKFKPTGYFLEVDSNVRAPPRLESLESRGDLVVSLSKSNTTDLNNVPAFGEVINDFNNWIRNGKQACNYCCANSPGNYNAYDLITYVYATLDGPLQSQVKKYYPELSFLWNDNIDVPDASTMQSVNEKYSS